MPIQLSDAELALVHVNQALQKMTAELERMHVASVAVNKGLMDLSDLGTKLAHTHWAVDAAFGSPGSWDDLGGYGSRRAHGGREEWVGRAGRDGRDGRGGPGGDGGAGGDVSPGGRPVWGKAPGDEDPLADYLGEWKDKRGRREAKKAHKAAMDQAAGLPLEASALAKGATLPPERPGLEAAGWWKSGSEALKPTSDKDIAAQRELNEKMSRHYDRVSRQGLAWGAASLESASPDVFGTLMGSFKLLAATIGTTLVPHAVTLAKVTQGAVRGFDALPAPLKAFSGGVLAAGLAAAAFRLSVTGVGMGHMFTAGAPGLLGGTLATGTRLGGALWGAGIGAALGAGVTGAMGGSAEQSAWNGLGGGLLGAGAGYALSGGASWASLGRFGLAAAPAAAALGLGHLNRSWLTARTDDSEKRADQDATDEMLDSASGRQNRRRLEELVKTKGAAGARADLDKEIAGLDKQMGQKKFVMDWTSGKVDRQGRPLEGWWGALAGVGSAVGGGQLWHGARQKEYDSLGSERAVLARLSEKLGLGKVDKPSAVSLTQAQKDQGLLEAAPLLMHFENKTQPGYFAPDELYRKIQLEAVQASPLQEALREIQQRQLDVMLENLPYLKPLAEKMGIKDRPKAG